MILKDRLFQRKNKKNKKQLMIYQVEPTTKLDLKGLIIKGVFLDNKQEWIIVSVTIVLIQKIGMPYVE